MKIYRQRLLGTIQERFIDNPIVALTGPRQVGKTTIAKDYVSKSGLNFHFFDLESPKDIARLANPKLVLSKLEGIIVLDKIQRMPKLFEVLRVLADRQEKPALFLILGSASPTLINNASESLAGRVSFIAISGQPMQAQS
jgi:predicted AAA+ superfamily ATPase